MGEFRPTLIFLLLSDILLASVQTAGAKFPHQFGHNIFEFAHQYHLKIVIKFSKIFQYSVLDKQKPTICEDHPRAYASQEGSLRYRL